jgi:hypothetical protein
MVADGRIGEKGNDHRPIECNVPPPGRDARIRPATLKVLASITPQLGRNFLPGPDRTVRAKQSPPEIEGEKFDGNALLFIGHTAEHVH